MSFLGFFFSGGLCLPLVNSSEYYNPIGAQNSHSTKPSQPTHFDLQTCSFCDVIFFFIQMQAAVLPTWPLVGHLSAQGCSGRRLLGGDGDGPLRRRGPVFDRLGGESSALSPTQVDLIGWN